MPKSSTVSKQAQAIQIAAHWGHYERTTIEPSDDATKARRVWKRKPVGGISEPIALDGAHFASNTGHPALISLMSLSKDSFVNVTIIGSSRSF